MSRRKHFQNFKLVTRSRSWMKSACLASACLILFAVSANGQTPAAKPVAQQERTADKFVIPDANVVDQDGKKFKFYSDLVKGKKVIINFAYTSCNGICPTTGGHFAKLQRALGEKVGKDIHMITITTDPETDTPERLKTWSKRFNPTPGWTFITGSVDEVTRLLQVFTGDGVSTGYHVPSICVVNDTRKSQEWTYGLSPIEDLLRAVDRM